MHIGQSTLSKQIYELESQLGLKLFERNHQIVELTDAGRALVEEAREALLHTERAVVAAKAVFNGADQIGALEKFVRKEPLRRTHHCVFGVLTLEREPMNSAPVVGYSSRSDDRKLSCCEAVCDEQLPGMSHSEHEFRYMS